MHFPCLRFSFYGHEEKGPSDTDPKAPTHLPFHKSQMLPGQFFAEIYEFARIAIRRKCRECDRRLRTFLDRDLAVRVHVRYDRARMRRVYLDSRIAEFVREMHCVTV